jgi:hypothetical protein
MDFYAVAVSGQKSRKSPGTTSRVDAGGAGWGGCRSVNTPATKAGRPRQSWLSPGPLWASRNQVVARVIGDPTARHRDRWLELLGRSDGDPLVVDRFAAEPTVSFLLAGDTGQGDSAQFAVARELVRHADGTAFLFLCSDVVYPAGGIEDYRHAVLEPYAKYAGPIYAIPGNHDWYDDADGFMYWFCGARRRPRRGVRGGLRELPWRRSPVARVTELEKCDSLRADAGQAGPQPGPYFALDAGPIRLVCLDTGLGGPLDVEQSAWLRRTSAEPGPKILLTGKPLYVDGRVEERPMRDGGTILGVVSDARHEYLAVISGDTHNYQRYLVTLGDGRRMPFIVSGGGGAFLHQTHAIPNLDELALPGVDEDSFRCYPLRGDSLARCSQLWGEKLGGSWRQLLHLDPDRAAAIAAERIGGTPVRPAARAEEASVRDHAVAELMYRIPRRPSGILHFPYSELLSWEKPPLFKHFLKVDAGPDGVRIACHAVTGCAEAGDPPIIEDALEAQRRDGAWEWTEVHASNPLE